MKQLLCYRCGRPTGCVGTQDKKGWRCFPLCPKVDHIVARALERTAELRAIEEADPDDRISADLREINRVYRVGNEILRGEIR